MKSLDVFFLCVSPIWIFSSASAGASVWLPACLFRYCEPIRFSPFLFAALFMILMSMHFRCDEYDTVLYAGRRYSIAQVRELSLPPLMSKLSLPALSLLTSDVCFLYSVPCLIAGARRIL